MWRSFQCRTFDQNSRRPFQFKCESRFPGDAVPSTGEGRSVGFILNIVSFFSETAGGFEKDVVSFDKPASS